MSPVWDDWQANRGGTQSSLQTWNNLLSEKKKTWQWLHSYGKSHIALPVTWSIRAGSHSKRKGGAGDFIWKPPVGFEWHAAHYVAVVSGAKPPRSLKHSLVLNLRPETQEVLGVKVEIYMKYLNIMAYTGVEVTKVFFKLSLFSFLLSKTAMLRSLVLSNKLFISPGDVLLQQIWQLWSTF